MDAPEIYNVLTAFHKLYTSRFSSKRPFCSSCAHLAPSPLRTASPACSPVRVRRLRGLEEVDEVGGDTWELEVVLGDFLEVREVGERMWLVRILRITDKCVSRVRWCGVF